ncbi:hypothetical protein BK744_01860 [Bacillus thuringiensis serovar zhaodongensis]|uniref:hypothetical protein n=1 Tax=Bacillus thuringiensis TaxID=1428 RepID=UPI000A37945E|nr:hypothetical protein [Bacillus thuringiensis]OUB80554.1 hypothetical protein BK744_01860 [Bacillus thuringiensis serovar zhaodongensis]
MILNRSFKKLSILTIICTMLIAVSSMGIFTDKASAEQPGHTLVKVETKVLANDPNSPDADVGLLVGLAGVIPAIAGIESVAKIIAITGFGLAIKTWLAQDDPPNSFTVKKYIYKSDQIKNNNYWGYYYVTVTNQNTGETVTSRTFVIGKTA